MLHHLRHREVMVGIEHLLQRRPLVPGHQEVKTATFLRRHDLREERRDDATGAPLFRHEDSDLVAIAGELGAQRLQHQRAAAFCIVHAVEQRHPRIVQQRINHESVEFLPRLQARWQGQACDLRKTVAQSLGRQLQDFDDDRRRIVLPPLRKRETGQRGARRLRLRVVEQDPRNRALRQHAPDTVGKQHETVAFL